MSNTVETGQALIDSKGAKLPVSTTHLGLFALLLGIIVAMPLVLYPPFAMRLLCFALYASAFNLLIGYGGLLSFGHAAFFGVASYACAYAAKTMGLTPGLAILGGVAVAGGLGLVLGAIATRRQGIYFSMITLALSQMVYFLCLQAKGITGGEDGIQNVPRGALFGLFDLSNTTTLYAVIAVGFLIGMVCIYLVIHSPFGQSLKAIRDNEARAISLGYNVQLYKIMVFTISATLAGFAGAMKVFVFQLASLTDVHWTMSGEVILMSLLGGLGTFFGPMVGAAIIISLELFAVELGEWVSVVQGGLFVLCVLLFRDGVLGTIGKRLKLSL